VCAVISSICKEKLSKTSHFMLKYSDLESLFLAVAEKSVYLDVWFCGDRALWQRGWHRPPSDGKYRLALLRHVPDWGRSEWWRPRSPWRDESKPNLVDCKVYALTNDVAAEVGITRATVREAMRFETKRFAEGGLFAHRWQIGAWLHAHDRKLECVSLSWTGVKLSGINKRLIDLDGDLG